MSAAIATFAAGCFWGPEYKFGKLDGVLRTSVGYMGGSLEHPTYAQVCTDRTGHAEVVQLHFDPARLEYAQLVRFFFEVHDPTTINRQGEDLGSQYRSVIFVHDDAQRHIAEQELQALNQTRFGGRIVTQIVAAGRFWPAEDYHQHYLDRHGPDACTV